MKHGNLKMNVSYDVSPNNLHELNTTMQMKGFCVIRELFSKAYMQKIYETTSALLKRPEYQDLHNLRNVIRMRNDNSLCADGFEHVSDLDPYFTDINENPKLKQIINTILGSNACLMKEKLIVKRPGTMGFGLHRDCDYSNADVGIPNNSSIKTFIAIEAMTLNNGPLVLYPGLHQKQLTHAIEDPRDIDPKAVADAEPYILTMQSGDVAFFFKFNATSKQCKQ